MLEWIRRSSRLPAVVVIPLVVVVAVVAVATLVQAVEQDSWGPILMTGWLPAVLVASLYRPAAGPSCRSRKS